MEGQDPRALYETVAANLKALRNGYNHGQGISQKELAKHLGITQQTYAAYENAQNRITLEMLSKIAAFHEVTLSRILNKTQGAASELMELDAKSFTEEELKEIMTFVRFVEQRRK